MTQVGALVAVKFLWQTDCNTPGLFFPLPSPLSVRLTSLMSSPLPPHCSVIQGNRKLPSSLSQQAVGRSGITKRSVCLIDLLFNCLRLKLTAYCTQLLSLEQSNMLECKNGCNQNKESKKVVNKGSNSPNNDSAINWLEFGSFQLSDIKLVCFTLIQSINSNQICYFQMQQAAWFKKHTF